ncbi:MAG: SH3 domain-containing protein [Candidatus Ventricola sp.]
MEEQEAQGLYVGRVETKGTLNVRAAPGGAIIGSLSPGDEVQVLRDEGEWVEIAWAGGTGYAAKRYICFARAKQEARIVITDEEGIAFTPAGGFTLRLASGPID